MDKLTLTPDQASYVATPGVEFLSVPLDGGGARCRRDQVGSSARVEVVWTLGRSDYRSLLAFHQDSLDRGSAPFLIDLVIGGPDVEEHAAYFVPGSLGLKGKEGDTYAAVAQLDVFPIDYLDDDIRALLLDLPQFGTEDMSWLFTGLSRVVNIDWPRMP
ncbi:MAG: hypothetical protein WCK73_10345 [Deltaproteobacteria bacterium]